MQLPMNVTKMLIIDCFSYVNKEKAHLLQFSLNLSQTSRKNSSGLHLHLPIFVITYLPFIYSIYRLS